MDDFNDGWRVFCLYLKSYNTIFYIMVVNYGNIFFFGVGTQLRFIVNLVSLYRILDSKYRLIWIKEQFKILYIKDSIYNKVLLNKIILIVITQVFL